MSASNSVLSIASDLPIRTASPVHQGKVRAVYWLTAKDSTRLIADRGYAVPAGTQLGVMIISDRLSAFECIWRAEGGLAGVPGKGAALNAISRHWFECFARAGLARSHILEAPHPLLWIVQRVRPLAIEAIARQYITGSMWRAYAAGERSFCGIELPDALQRNQRLPTLLMTPSTKGILRGIPGVPAADDVNVSTQQLREHFAAFGFACAADVARYERLLGEGFALIEGELLAHDMLFVDTKFEFGYAATAGGGEELIYMDEVGTPDSSRIWDGEAYRGGKVVESSKESFRQALLAYFPDPNVLLDKGRMDEREALARTTLLPRAFFGELSRIYTGLARQITGASVALCDDPRSELLTLLASDLALVD